MTPPNLDVPVCRTMADAESGTALSFIEVQFPVSKLSKESYKERKAGIHQTLPGLGKWWGRKPLVLCRATILGLLMPATTDPERDREVFLKLMTMDDKGLWLRKAQSMSLTELFAALPNDARDRYFTTSSGRPSWTNGLSKTHKGQAHAVVFDNLSYDEKLTYCRRPEEIAGPSPEDWADINAHLGTDAHNLTTLIEQLGVRRFGRRPRVGDAFCGGGSIPFEASRLGCDGFGSDLNPVAALLTWSALRIVGGGPDIVKSVHEAQRHVFDSVEREITQLGIEHNEHNWRADAYLYCLEVTCPECNWSIPLAPSWVISTRHNTIAKLSPHCESQSYQIEIANGVTHSVMERAKKAGTVQDSCLICPNPKCLKSTPIKSIRGDREGGSNALRLWDKSDVVFRDDDIFRERLYCIRWAELKPGKTDRSNATFRFQAPSQADLARESKVLSLLVNKLDTWQVSGIVPSRRIEPGEKTSEPIRTRGWTHWHQLFNPRQLLSLGLLAERSRQSDLAIHSKVGLMIALSRSRITTRGFLAGIHEKTARTLLKIRSAIRHLTLYTIMQHHRCLLCRRHL